MSAKGQQLFFYSSEGFAFAKHGSTGYHALFRAGGQALAQWREGGIELGVTDGHSSVLRLLGGDTPYVMAYTAYGRDSGEVRASLLGFNGQRRDIATGHYLLGDGYRAFSPALMRFISPDSLSPFLGGGINAYGYCGGDPVNKVDLSGHMFRSIFGRWLKSFPGTPRRSSNSIDSVQPRMSQRDANQILSARLDRHNQAVHQRSYEGGLAYLGSGIGTKVESISQAGKASFNDHVFVEGVAVSLTRDYPVHAHVPGFEVVFTNTVKLERRIAAALPLDAVKDKNEKWPLNVANERTRTDGSHAAPIRIVPDSTNP